MHHFVKKNSPYCFVMNLRKYLNDILFGTIFFISAKLDIHSSIFVYHKLQQMAQSLPLARKTRSCGLNLVKFSITIYITITLVQAFMN